MTRKNHDKMKHTSSNLSSFGQLVVLQQRPLRRYRVVDAPKLSGNDHGGAAAANNFSSRTTRVNAAEIKAQMIKVEQEKKDDTSNVIKMSTSSQALVPYYKSPRLRAKFQAALEGSNNITMTTTAKSAAVNDSSDIMKKRIGSTTVASEGRKKKSEATKVVTVTQPTPLKNGLNSSSMNQKRHWSLRSSTNCAQTTQATKKNRVNDDNVDNPVVVPSEERQEKIHTTLPSKDSLPKKRRGRPPKTSNSSSARDKRITSTKAASVLTTNSKGRGQSLRKGVSTRRNTSDRFVKNESPYSPSRTNIKVEKSLPRSTRKVRKALRSAQKTKRTTNAATTTYYHCASETTKITSIKELNIVNDRREARSMSAREVRIIKRSYLKQTSSTSSTSMRCINPLQDSTNIVNSRHAETHAHHEKVTNNNKTTHSVDKDEVIALDDKEEPSHTVLPPTWIGGNQEA